jgi:GT2 family glycosyltransferase
VPAPSVCAVILNWNGGEDTVKCLQSLSLQTLKPARIVVVDNGSTDDSLARIGEWKDVHVIASSDNLGFAAGSNLGIRYALGAGADLVFLLNNDTVLEPGALAHLVDFMTAHPEHVACTGQIRYLGRPVVWNCGGDLTWFGSRRYLFGESPVSVVPQTGWRPITFITGAAMLVRTSTFATHGLFTERFFFGEEDYEFSQRLKRAGLRVACVFEAVIHHKVGSSIDRAAPSRALGRYYVYYLNRFIDMRSYYPRPIWWVWRMASLVFVIPRLKVSRGFSWSAAWLLARRLLRDSATLDGVPRERFEVATRSGLESL